MNVKDYQTLYLGAIIGLSIALSTFFLMGGIIKYQKLQNQAITVTGSASQEVTSDFGTLTIGYKAQAYSLAEGYRLMEKSKLEIEKFFENSGFEYKDLEFSPITSYEVYRRVGNYTTNEVESYRLSADVKVSSDGVNVIDNMSKKMDKLVNKGVDVSYTNTEYFIKDLDQIKIDMVGSAAANAKDRAQSIMARTGGKIGPMLSAKTGVFQIVPANSTEVSDYGINDTSSINKKVISVVNATFSVK